MTIVTAYETLGEEGLLHSMRETEVEAIYTTAELLPVVAKVIDKCFSCRCVIYHGEASDDILDDIRFEGMREVLSFDELVRRGRAEPVDPVPPKPEDLCCVSTYTHSAPISCDE